MLAIMSSTAGVQHRSQAYLLQIRKTGNTLPEPVKRLKKCLLNHKAVEP